MHLLLLELNDPKMPLAAKCLKELSLGMHWLLKLMCESI